MPDKVKFKWQKPDSFYEYINKKMYNGSEQQLENFKKASIAGNKVIQENKQKRVEEYNKNPNVCKQCGEYYDKKGEAEACCSMQRQALQSNKK